MLPVDWDIFTLQVSLKWSLVGSASRYLAEANAFLSLFLKYLFWLCWVLVAFHRVFVSARRFLVAICRILFPGQVELGRVES